jgi:hypothetical protein
MTLMHSDRHYQLVDRKGEPVGEITELLANRPDQRWYSWCYLNDAQDAFETRWEAERYLKLQAGFPKERKQA